VPPRKDLSVSGDASDAERPDTLPRTRHIMRNILKLLALALALAPVSVWLVSRARFRASASDVHQALSAPFQYKVLTPEAEVPFELRFFTTAVKTES